MGIWVVPWYTPVLMEANKFWFYALCMSILCAAWELLFESAALNEPEKGYSDVDEKETAVVRPSSKPSSVTAQLIMLMTVDGCDLALPVSFLRWIAIPDSWVGVAMVVSTVIASIDIWEDAQQ